jgi:hypothetical protein
MPKEIFDLSEIARFKQKFNYELKPIKDMLLHRKEEMSTDQWMDFVEQTRQSILNNPDQFLEKVLPKKDILELIVNKIFEEFLI